MWSENKLLLLLPLLYYSAVAAEHERLRQIPQPRANFESNLRVTFVYASVF